MPMKIPRVRFHPTKDFLTTIELAARWADHIKPGTLENWRSDGKGPKYIKLTRETNGPIIYRIVDVLAYEKDHTITPKED